MNVMLIGNKNILTPIHELHVHDSSIMLRRYVCMFVFIVVVVEAPPLNCYSFLKNLVKYFQLGLIARNMLTRRFASYAVHGSASLPRPHYDFKNIRTNVELLEKCVARRKVQLPNGASVGQLVHQYESMLTVRANRDHMVSTRNQLARDKQNKDQNLARLKELKSQIKSCDAEIARAEAAVLPAIEALPNLIAPGVPDSEPELVAMINEHNYRDPRPELAHQLVGPRLGLMDFETASTVSGSRSYYLLNDAVLLEQALIQFALKKCMQNGFKAMAPPSLVKHEFTNACGFKPRDNNNEQQIYSVDGPDLCLTGTAEIPMAGWAARKTLASASGAPIKNVGVSRSFRAEAGARGADTKGLYRVHEFNKVEMFAFTSPEHSSDMHEQMLEIQKQVFTDLGLCCRVLNMPADDLGAPAYKKYDIEAWMPGRNSWGEVSSTSNCLDYQARRLHTKWQNHDGSVTFAHTLNGTAMAVPRVIIAIIESFYDQDRNAIRVPPVLQDTMGKDWIECTY